MFEQIRASLRDLLSGARTPEDRRAAIHQMKETLVRARMGVEDLQQALSRTRVELGLQRKELETVLRRKKLAEGIGDTETVTIAARFEQKHAERIAVLERKLAVQEEECSIVEAEVAAMGAELRAAAAGAMPPGTAGPNRLEEDPLDDGSAALATELDGLSRSQRRAAAEQAAADRLAELKRRMGK